MHRPMLEVEQPCPTYMYMYMYGTVVGISGGTCIFILLLRLFAHTREIRVVVACTAQFLVHVHTCMIVHMRNAEYRQYTSVYSRVVALASLGMIVSRLAS